MRAAPGAGAGALAGLSLRVLADPQRLAMYIVISMPKRQSIACGFSQTMVRLLGWLVSGADGGALGILGRRERAFNGWVVKGGS
jgi:hypothetical protein